jgi:predicted O-methyltransferase YrrM
MTNPIDQAHCELIYGLAVSLKPRAILELGYGQGASARALWRAVVYNGIQCQYDLVDDWRDHAGRIPQELEGMEKIFSMTEVEFYRTNFEFECYDLILSDADHEHAHQWFDQSLAMLRSPGLLIYHDVCNPNHPALGDLISRADSAGLSRLVFNKNSRPGEQCNRGLLVISK